MTTDLSIERMDRNVLIAEIATAGVDVSRPSAICCPFHDDHNPSAGVYQADDGAWKFKCHAGSCGFCGDVFDVRAKLRKMSVKDVLKEHGAIAEKRPTRSFASVNAAMQHYGASHSYLYTHPDSRKVELVVLRIPETGGRKSFRQGTVTDDGSVHMRAPAKPWPIYNRLRCRNAEHVVVVEGEKDVHALHGLGIVATTSPGGSSNPQHADWSILAGKRITIWPDHDEAGQKYSDYVAGKLERLGCDVSVVDVSLIGVGPGGDVSDFVALHPDASEAARIILESADTTTPSRQVEQIIDQMIDGTRQAVSWPWEQLGNMTRALMPGKVVLVCGDPGSTKSLMLLQAMAYWHGQGIKVALFELEDDRAYHLHRCMAQMALNANLTDDRWIRGNPDDAREAVSQHAGFMDSFGLRVWDAPESQESHMSICNWVDDRIAEGCRIIGIDPITAVEQSETPWIDDAKFLIRVKTAIRKANASLILVTHPKKGRKSGRGFDELAGGAAYARFAHTILWLESLLDPKEVHIRQDTAFGSSTESATINRTMHIVKARDGVGTGRDIGLWFNRDTLCIDEVGMVGRNA